MYAKNENAQAIESRNRVRDALLRLMKKYPYKDITITQICQEAQIVRQTYYRNFDVKDDILEYHLDRMFQEYFVSYYERGQRIQLENFFRYMLQCAISGVVEKNDLFFM
jgi:AcrR family transcriptional regulator